VFNYCTKFQTICFSLRPLTIHANLHFPTICMLINAFANLVPRASVWGRGETRGSPGLGQRRLDSRPQSIMGIERLIPRVTSLTVDCRGVNISLTKAIWSYGSFRTTRVSGCDTLWKETACYCCIVAIIIMTCVLLYQVYLLSLPAWDVLSFPLCCFYSCTVIL
jgi:hypothetical protein